MRFETEFINEGSGIVKLKIEGTQDLIKGVVTSQDNNNWTIVIPYTSVDLNLNSSVLIPELEMELPAKLNKLGIIWKKGEIPKLKLDVKIINETKEIKEEEKRIEESPQEIELNLEELMESIESKVKDDNPNSSTFSIETGKTNDILRDEKEPLWLREDIEKSVNVLKDEKPTKKGRKKSYYYLAIVLLLTILGLGYKSYTYYLSSKKNQELSSDSKNGLDILSLTQKLNTVLKETDQKGENTLLKDKGETPDNTLQNEENNSNFNEPTEFKTQNSELAQAEMTKASITETENKEEVFNNEEKEAQLLPKFTPETVFIPLRWAPEGVRAYRTTSPISLVIDITGSLPIEDIVKRVTSQGPVKGVKLIEKENGVRLILYLTYEFLPKYRLRKSDEGIFIDFIGPDPRYISPQWHASLK